MKNKKYEALFTTRLVEEGVNYLRQVGFGFYVLDFVVPSRLLVIEIDGSEHKYYSKKFERERDSFIKKC